MKGMLITFEGGEGSGKTTQTRLLEEYLENMGYAVILTREPGGTKIGEEVRGILADVTNKKMSPMTEFLLFSAARAQHVEELIVPALKKGKIIISDRFYDASFAYQGYGRGLSLKLISHITLQATKKIKPQLTFFLDIDPKDASGRIKKRSNTLDRIEKEKLSFFFRVRKGYYELCKKEPSRIKIIDGSQGIEKVHKKIILEIERKLMLATGD